MEVELFILERRMITLKDSIEWYKKHHKYREYFRCKREYKRCNKKHRKLKEKERLMYIQEHNKKKSQKS